MRALSLFYTISLFLLIFFFIFPSPLFADEYDSITHQLEQLKESLEKSREETQKKEQTIQELHQQLEAIKRDVAGLESEIAKKQANIKEKEEQIYTHKNKLNMHISSYYKYLGSNANTLAQLFTSEHLSVSLKHFFYHKTMMEEDKRVIVRTISILKIIEDQKKQLETEKARLLPIKEEINEQSALLAEEVQEAEFYEIALEKQIAELSEKQKQILSARSGGGATTRVGTVPTSGDPASTLAFKSQAPANSFAAFSFGAYTHRNGMSQYGAKARAEQGQTAEDILATYFPGSTLNKEYAVPDSIEVQGYGTLNFQEYLYGIYEMPESWHREALKAQAVLARTYAIGAGKPICTTEACQVYGGSPKTGAWKEAVDETATWVLENTPNAQYSSTTGGYTNNAGWDTEDGSNTGDWTARAYESKANSPWFYRAWYRQGYRDDANSCGREHPWLSQQEMADIINAWIVRKNPNGADTNRIIPTTINDCPVGSTSGNPYSYDELRDAAHSSGGAVESISGVSVSHSNDGQTTNVHFETNRGSLDIPGTEFKETFNIRAPGYISIPQFSYSFFHIEKT